MAGSRLVDRAEANLIIANTPVDVKALIEPSLLPWQYMVVMYALEDAAVLLARHGVLVRCNLDETLERGGRLTRTQARDRIRASLRDSAP